MRIQSGFGPIAVLAATASLAGCGVHSGGLVPSPTQAGSQYALTTVHPLAAGFVSPNAVPPNCKGQTTTKQYASDKEKFETKGGSICIPAFRGLGGSVTYPPANPSVSVSLISSTTNYNHKLPSLHKGAPVFYLQVSIPSGTSFGQNAPAGGGLTGNPIKAGSSYTAYGQAVVFGIKFKFTPCYAVATKGKYGGVIGGVGTLLKGQSVPGAAAGVIEIYSGKSATSKC
jgi:hypothetical protein